jgi:hypothetical protein
MPARPRAAAFSATFLDWSSSIDAGGGDGALDLGWVKIRPLPHVGEWESLGMARSPCLGIFMRSASLSGPKKSSWSTSAAGV